MIFYCRIFCLNFYVDDLLFLAWGEAGIHELALVLLEEGFDLQQEDDAAGLLIVNIVRNSETILIYMRQDGLINIVVEALVLMDGAEKVKWNPAEAKILVNGEDGLPMYGKFSYISVVGMLL